MASDPSRSALEVRLSRWGAPATYVAVVVAVGTLLVAILTRSPDTKSNYQASAIGYHRTTLASILGPEQYPGLSRDLGDDPAAVFVGAGCAGCHGLHGEGGPVGPEIRAKDLKAFTSAVRDGDGGMPAFSPERLSDAQIASLVTYLHDLKSQYPNEPARKPARADAAGKPARAGAAGGGAPAAASPAASATATPGTR